MLLVELFQVGPQRGSVVALETLKIPPSELPKQMVVDSDFLQYLDDSSSIHTLDHVELAVDNLHLAEHRLRVKPWTSEVVRCHVERLLEARVGYCEVVVGQLQLCVSIAGTTVS